MTLDDAIAVAERLAAERGWKWEGPVRVQTTADGYEVRTNTERLGQNVVVVVGFDGAVKHAGYNPR